jgi:gluconate 2-dehydrogenase gamma chain
MTKHDEARRRFLLGAAVGATAAAGAAFVPDALAQTQHEHAMPAHEHGGEHAGNGLGTFFNQDDAATVEAFTERLMPGAPGMAGARDAGVLNYIDLALDGAYADLQNFYRRGLASLDAYCQKTNKASFVQLSEAKQDEVIKALEDGKASEFTWPSARAFFNTLRTHTIEGMFADPVYGGNRDFAGWKLVGFPGAQPFFSPQDLQSREAFAGPSVIGLQAQTANRKG